MLTVQDVELRLVRQNVTPETWGMPVMQVGQRLRDVLVAADADEAERQLRRVMGSGVSLMGWEQQVRWRGAPTAARVLSVTALRLQGDDSRLLGVAMGFTDVTERVRARRRLDLLRDAATGIGGSLDVHATAEAVAKVFTRGFCDVAAVDVATEVLSGEEPRRRVPGAQVGLHRVAVAQAGRDEAVATRETRVAGAPAPAAGLTREFVAGQSIRIDDILQVYEAFAADRYLLGAVPDDDNPSCLAVPVQLQGMLLGRLLLWRADDREPFDDIEVATVEEIASRAALTLDNARRFTGEHRTVVVLQRSLLPPSVRETPAAETAGIYLPATAEAGVGGDWFDVIPLSSLRVAFLVGDVVGHGLQAAAAMGRFRMVVRTLADLDLAPDELLTQVDDLVFRLSAEREDDGGEGALGATMVYAVYDPVARRCVLASAGHPPPCLVRPDGAAEYMDVEPGPPLGVGGMPFEVSDIEMEPGSLLAFYTDGLVKAHGDIASGMERLRRRLADASGRDPRPELSDLAHEACSGDMTSSRDDAALLVARTRAIPADRTAYWEFAAKPEIASRARELTVRQLSEWHLEDAAFITELVVSELVTNAIRYGGAPVGLRLVRDRVLVCEVSDPSNTQPRLRRARTTDEGGRGLFMVAQLTQRWGSRYGRTGKTIWTEQALGVPIDG
ncbi:SpoIIE family protein phosphatase [Streptomyces sp. NPDC047009]|uniref:SpoIIE family protein phosphatase n=1 Tax=Streptomyces sp. NPDC047009 TaxID=3154496 RepID=UPI0034055575